MNCGHEISDLEKNTNGTDRCPLCKARFVNGNFTTHEALRWVVENRGVDILLKGEMTYSLLSDITKPNERGKQYIKSALQWEMGGEFHKIWTESNKKPKDIELKQFKERLLQKGAAEDVADYILNVFLFSVSSSRADMDVLNNAFVANYPTQNSEAKSQKGKTTTSETLAYNSNRQSKVGGSNDNNNNNNGNNKNNNNNINNNGGGRDDGRKKIPLPLIFALAAAAVLVIVLSVKVLKLSNTSSESDGKTSTVIASNGNTVDAPSSVKTADDKKGTGAGGNDSSSDKKTGKKENDKSNKTTSTSKPTATPVPEIIITKVEKYATSTTEVIKMDPNTDKGTDEELLSFSSAYASSAKEDGTVGSTKVSRSPKCAIDLDAQSSWQEASPGDGSGESITLSFSQKHTIKYLNMYLGNWRIPISGTNFYDNNNSPKQMTMIADGQKYSMTFSRDQVLQRVVFDEPIQTKELTFIIDSVYYGKDGENDCCISEIIARGTY